MAKVAAAIRTRLRDETDLDVLRSYQTLWELEFQSRPPTEHEAVRKSVSGDLQRLEAAVPAPDSEFQSSLISGYKLSGASAEMVRAKEDRLLKEFPKSSEARRITEDRWDRSHPEPADQSDTVAWERYNQQHREAMKRWIEQFTDDYQCSNYEWKELVDRDGPLSEKEVLALFESDLKEAEEAEFLSSGSARAAHFLLRRKVRPEVAMATLEKARQIQEQERGRERRDTNRTPDAIVEEKARLDLLDRSITAEMVSAARQLKRPELVETMRTQITTPPADPWFIWMYWVGRARLALLDGHNADALAYYQLANQTIPLKPQMRHGKFWDEQGDEIKDLWKEMGGTDEAWQTWNKQPDKGEQASEGLWTKPNQQLPEFTLADLAGKTWQLKDLAGRTTLITVWATWCGPCMEELPHVEKLYQRIKERNDIQLVTFNVDENPGLVQPFLKQHQYKFPVMLAHGFVNATVDRIGIPQNWVVDPQAKWVATIEAIWERLGRNRGSAVGGGSQEFGGCVRHRGRAKVTGSPQKDRFFLAAEVGGQFFLFLPDLVHLCRNCVLQFFHAFAGDRRDGTKVQPLLFAIPLQFSELVFIGGVNLRRHHQHGLIFEAGAEACQFGVNHLNVFDRVGPPTGVGNIHHVNQQACALNMFQELDSQA